MRPVLPLIAPLAGIAVIATACSPAPKTASQPAKPAAAAEAQAPNEAAAGAYFMDPAHTSVNFRINHLGLSHYTARFTKVSGELTFDPANPAAQSVTAMIDATSLQTNYPDPAKLDFDSQVEKEFLDTAHFPQITFKSTKVEVTGPKTANITGDLTLHGVTKPVTFDVVFNGAGRGLPPGFGPIAGFSATTKIKRSDFGSDFLNNGIVGDEVTLIIEAEFDRK